MLSNSCQPEVPLQEAAISPIKHLITVDALRGFAALSVCLFHLGGASLPKLSSSATIALTSWGWTGVEVFFVISGFIIPYVLLRTNYKLRDGPLFLARRVVRIWPPSAIAITLTIGMYLVAQNVGTGRATDWSDLSLGRVLANFAYAVPFTNHSWLNGVLWTLSVEFQFYLVLALILPLLTKGPGWLLVALLASSVSALLPIAETAHFFQYAIYFAMGGAALLHMEGKIRDIPIVGLLLIMAGIGAGQIGLLSAAFALGAALMICFANLRWRPLIFLGTISYSLYLTHILIGAAAEFTLVRLFSLDTSLERLIAQLACVGTAIAGAWIFTLLAEAPFIRLSQAMRKGRRSHRPRFLTTATV